MRSFTAIVSLFVGAISSVASAEDIGSSLGQLATAGAQVDIAQIQATESLAAQKLSADAAIDLGAEQTRQAGIQAAAAMNIAAMQDASRTEQEALILREADAARLGSEAIQHQELEMMREQNNAAIAAIAQQNQIQIALMRAYQNLNLSGNSLHASALRVTRMDPNAGPVATAPSVSDPGSPLSLRSVSSSRLLSNASAPTAGMAGAVRAGESIRRQLAQNLTAPGSGRAHAGPNLKVGLKAAPPGSAHPAGTRHVPKGIAGDSDAAPEAGHHH